MKINQLIKDMTDIGLTEYEAKVYVNLLKRDTFTAAEIANASGVPRSKVYEILKHLCEKSFVTEILGRVKKYTAVSPEQGFAILKKQQEEEFIKKNKQMTKLSQQLHEFYGKRENTNGPLDYIQVLRDKRAINSKIISLMENAKEEVLFFNKSPYISRIEDNKSGLELMAKSIEVRSIYEMSDSADPSFYEAMLAFHRAGEKIMIVPTLPLKMAVFDRSSVLLMLLDKLPSTSTFTTMIIEHKDLANMFISIFDFFWEQGLSPEFLTNKDNKKE